MKVRAYKLTRGGVSLIVQDIAAIVSELENEQVDESEKLSYSLTIEYIEQYEIDNLPDFDGF